MSRALVVLSGGLDSTVCLAMAAEENDLLTTVTFSYGQKHIAELDAAWDVSAEYGADHHIIELPDIFGGTESTLIASNDLPMPNVSYEDLQESYGVSPTYVPYRNGNFLSMAAAMALTKEADTVWAGMHAEDAHNWAYPDCTPEFLGAMANAIYVGTYHKVRLITPLSNMTKSQVVWEGHIREVPFELTLSCYEGTRPACGKCPTCIGRLQAFADRGLTDPLEYEV